ncbi:MAG: hypothetical protein AB9915_03490 [Candidatus Dojkabacteria bacterium]
MESKNTILDNSGQQLLNESKIDSYQMIFIYSFQNFLRWWYVKMPIWHLRRLARLIVVVDDQFSISLLLRNFFIPWHRDYSMIGVIFGIIMKLLYLPIAISIYLISLVAYLLVTIGWIVLPIATIAYILTSIFR